MVHWFSKLWYKCTCTHLYLILTSPIADHFMNFRILEGDQYIYIYIYMFKISISKADIISKIDSSISANLNSNYNILSSIISNFKDSHIPKKLHIIKTWMTDVLMNQINK